MCAQAGATGPLAASSAAMSPVPKRRTLPARAARTGAVQRVLEALGDDEPADDSDDTQDTGDWKVHRPPDQRRWTSYSRLWQHCWVAHRTTARTHVAALLCGNTVGAYFIGACIELRSASYLDCASCCLSLPIYYLFEHDSRRALVIILRC